MDARDMLLEEGGSLTICRNTYWRPGKCDALPEVLGPNPCRRPVQHRPRRGPRILPRAADNVCGPGITADGKIGLATIVAPSAS